MQLRHAASTDIGRGRDHNEDTYAIEVSPERVAAGALFIVCDGMGGYSSGEVASDLAAETIATRYYTAGPDPAAALRTAFLEANERVLKRGRGKMGTTGVAALFLNGVVLLANVGDSRAYLIRGGVPSQLTQDHSFVSEQVSAGVLTAEQAQHSSYRNFITRALGLWPEVEVDLFQEPLADGDRVLLCSDGLHSLVETAEIAEVAGTGPVENAVQQLTVLANDRGGSDNITAVLIEVVQTDPVTVLPLPASRTVRLDAPVAPRFSGQTERLQTTSERGGRAAVPVANETTRRQTQYHPQPTPPLGSGTLQRRSRLAIIGQILVTLMALALLGGLFWFVMTGNPSSVTAPPTPTLPALTPPGREPSGIDATTTAAPTLVPTAASTPMPTVAPSITAGP